MHHQKKIRFQSLAEIARVVAFVPMTAPEIGMVTGFHQASILRMLREDRDKVGIGIVRWTLRERMYTAMYAMTGMPDVPRPPRKTRQQRNAEYLARLKVDPDLMERRRLTFTKSNLRKRKVKVCDPLMLMFYRPLGESHDNPSTSLPV